jgi:hexokinase
VTTVRISSDSVDASPESSVVCAVDLGGTKFEAGLVTLTWALSHISLRLQAWFQNN